MLQNYDIECKYIKGDLQLPDSLTRLYDRTENRTCACKLLSVCVYGRWRQRMEPSCNERVASGLRATRAVAVLMGSALGSSDNDQMRVLGLVGLRVI